MIMICSQTKESEDEEKRREDSGMYILYYLVFIRENILQNDILEIF